LEKGKNEKAGCLVINHFVGTKSADKIQIARRFLLREINFVLDFADAISEDPRKWRPTEQKVNERRFVDFEVRVLLSLVLFFLVGH